MTTNTSSCRIIQLREGVEMGLIGAWLTCLGQDAVGTVFRILLRDAAVAAGRKRKRCDSNARADDGDGKAPGGEEGAGGERQPQTGPPTVAFDAPNGFHFYTVRVSAHPSDGCAVPH